MRPKISFIIPAYNVANYINSCVESVLSQTYTDIEVIVVNDGSVDNTKEVVDALSAKDDRVFAFHKKNEGVSAARNSGIEVCTGEYVVFVDADDYLAPDYAEYMLSIIEQTGGEFCLSLNCYTQKNEKQVKKDSINVYSPDEATALLLSPRVIVGSWNKIFKKSLLDDYGIRFSPDLFYGEGLRFVTLASQSAKCIGVGHRKVYYYRRNNYMSATSKFNIEKFYNGMKSIDEIGRELRRTDKKVQTMWSWHKCQFCMGVVVRIKSEQQVAEYNEYYRQNLMYVKKHAFDFMFIKSLPLYNRAILIGTAISPSIMSWLYNCRIKLIARNSF